MLGYVAPRSTRFISGISLSLGASRGAVIDCELVYRFQIHPPFGHVELLILCLRALATLDALVPDEVTLAYLPPHARAHRRLFLWGLFCIGEDQEEEGGRRRRRCLLPIGIRGGGDYTETYKREARFPARWDHHAVAQLQP